LDTLTHGLTGIGLACVVQEIAVTPQTGLVATALIASQLPDIDVALGSKGKVNYIKHHRGFTHSLLLSPFYALLPAFGVWLFTPGSGLGLLYLVSLLSILLHLFLDLLNSYGTKILWPFSKQRYAWDLLMVIDPLIILVFLSGLVLYMLGRGNEFLFFIFPILVLYLLTMYKFRLKAKTYLLKFFKKYKDFALMPPLLGWRRWNFILFKGQVYYLGQIDIFTGQVRIKETLCKKKECELVKATKEEPEVQVFLEFARFPWFAKQEKNGEVLIEWSDLRYRLREGNHFCLLTKAKTDN